MRALIDCFKKRLTGFFYILIFSLAYCLASPLAADEQADVRRAVAEGRIRPLTEILNGVSAHYPGARVIDVEIEREKPNNLVYEIKLIDGAGKKFKLKVDAANGQVINNKAANNNERKLIPMLDFLRKVQQIHPGQIINAELIHSEWDAPHYEVTLRAPDGKTFELTGNALTGELSNNPARSGWDDRTLKPMPDVLEFIQKKYPGLIVEAELEHTHNGRPYYDIEIKSDDGSIFEIHVDARNLDIIDN